jgi:hypothetical protein
MSCLSPKTPQELWNLRQSQLRTTVERAFGGTRKKLKAFRYGTSFPPQVQARVILACCLLHNFIKMNDVHDSDMDDQEEDVEDNMQPQDADVEPEDEDEMIERQRQWGISAAETAAAEAMRDDLAQSMWDDYQRVLRERAMA